MRTGKTIICLSVSALSATAALKPFRMKEACRIARQNPDIRVNELGMAVGINTPKYFTRCFKEEIGMLPSEYIEKVKRREV